LTWIRAPIRVIAPNTKALIASARRAQVTATPGVYERIDDSVLWESRKVDYTQPLPVLGIPGMPELRIGTHPMRVSTWSGAQFRYAWRHKATARKWPMPTHFVTETEWFSLLERFGLGTLIDDECASGKLDRRERFAKVFWGAFFALLLVATTAFGVWYVWQIVAHGRP
jgi:hypothetical protein